MSRCLFLLGFGFLMSSISAQVYFPPIDGEEWDTLQPAELGYCPDRIDSLYAFLDDQNSRSFLLLKDGRIVLEHYANGGSQDGFWYWASAGKCLTTYMIGIAQSQGLLDIHQPTSTYLGEGWTSMTPEQEILITPWHQLTMTTGLADGDISCLEPECLTYLEDPGERWFYNSQGSRLLNDVLTEVTGLGPLFHTQDLIGERIGMGGFWFEYVYNSTARDMARFGLLAMNSGVWDGDTLITDTDFLADMTSTASPLNPSYGYLWWLNGQDGYVLPTLDFILPGTLIPSAPTDVFAALGKNDQKIYVSQSEGLVVVRQGEAADGIVLGPSSFDNALWEKINELSCPLNAEEHEAGKGLDVFPNPTTGGGRLQVKAPEVGREWKVQLFDRMGRVISASAIRSSPNPLISLELPTHLDQGIYHLVLTQESGIARWSETILIE